MQEEIAQENLEIALAILKTKDIRLFKNNVSERAMCFRLGLYLDFLFGRFYVVDMEYNRLFGNPKSHAYKTLYQLGVSLCPYYFPNHHNIDLKVRDLLKLKIEDTLERSRNTVPDIVLHKRIRNDNNFLVLEVKQANPYTANEDIMWDHIKLLAFMGEEYNYTVAFFLWLGVDAGMPQHLLQSIRKGEYFRIEKPHWRR